MGSNNIGLLSDKNPLIKHAFRFQETLYEMFENKANTDVIIECDGEEFHVHKLILTASSTYFRKMFENNLLEESNTNTIKFPTISSEIMKVIINFLYFNENPLPKESDFVMEVFKAAHLLEIRALVEGCAEVLAHNLDMNNLCEAWSLADLYEDNGLVSSLTQFSIDHLEELMQSPTFLKLQTNNIVAIFEKIGILKENLMENILSWVKHKKERKIHLGKICSLFSVVDFSTEYITHLIENECLVKETPEILLLLLKESMQKKNMNIPVKSPKESRAKNFCITWGLNSFSGIPLRLDLPFRLTKGMTCIADNTCIYFIGGEEKNSGEKLTSPRNNGFDTKEGSTTVIRYDVKSNTCLRKSILSYPVYNALAFVQDDVIHVVGGRNQNDKVYIQSFSVDMMFNSRIDDIGNLSDIKFICRLGNRFVTFH